MGNVSRRLKRKQQTLKRESQMPEQDAVKSADDETNGEVTKNIQLSLEQAGLAKNLLQAVNESRNVHIEAQSRWEAFLIGVGMCSGDEILGGDLDSDDPNKRCLTIKTSNGIARE